MTSRSSSSSSSTSSSSSSSFIPFLIFFYLCSSTVQSSTHPSHHSHSKEDSTKDKINIALNEAMMNESLYEGENLVLRCEITGNPLPKYTWHREGVRLDKKHKANVKAIVWGSRLKISSVSPSDQGLYNCTGRNTKGVVSTHAYVTVEKGPKPHRHSKTSHRSQIEDTSLDQDEDMLPIYPMGGHDEGPDEGEDNHLGLCQPYVGQVCARYLINRSVFVYDINHQEMQEEWLGDIISRLTSSKDISIPCKTPLEAAICTYAFPTCNPSDADKRGRIDESKSQRLCRDECEVVHNMHCEREYGRMMGGGGGGFGDVKQAMMETNRRGSLTKILNVTDCGSLSRTSDRHHCNSAGIPLSPYNHHEDCYEGDGSRYRGSSSTSISERSCVWWGVAGSRYEPTPSGYVLMTHNLCRNVNGSMTAPWCYIIRGGMAFKEACGIPACEPSADNQHTALMLGLPCVLLFVLIVSIVLAAKLRRHKAKQKELSEPQSTKALLERQSITSKRPLPFISPASVTLAFELFEGRFGKIYKGELVSSNNQKPSPVVLKTLEASLDATSQADFWRELDAVNDLQHSNITCVVGANKTSPPCFAVFEGSSYGSLNEYLRTNSHLVDSQCLDVGSIVRSSILPQPVLVSVAIQVANALEYLHSTAHIHSQLNTLNVLVCENGLVKISLVNASQGLYYCKVGARVLLLRWSAPEILLGQKATEKSDIWSLGVLLWEIYSCADVPYKSSTDLEVMESVKSMKILSCPLQCPASLYSLMVQCWHKIPTSRPTASEVHGSLRSAWNELTNAGSVTQSSGSEKSHQTLDQYKFAYDCQPLVPLPNTNHHHQQLHQAPLFPYQPLVNSNFSTSHNNSNHLLPTQSSTISQKSSPSSSNANFKDKLRGTDTPKMYGFLNNDLYNEQII